MKAKFTLMFSLSCLIFGLVGLTVTVSAAPNAPTNYCTASINEEDETIARVQVGDIDYTSGFCDGTPYGYCDFTAQSTSMRIGVAYPITITLSGSYSSDKGGIWVDWNHDEDFDDADETIPMRVCRGKGPYYADIVPPAHALAGAARMRVRMRYHSYPEPCDRSNYGEIEDYTIIVQPDAAPFFAHSTKTAVVDYDAWRITYTVAISNAGDLHGYNTYLTDTLPMGTTYVPNSASASTGTVTPSTNTLEWRGDILSGITEFLSFSVTLDDAPLTYATFTNTAYITHTDAPEWAAPQHIVRISPPHFTATKQGPPAAALNGPLTYTFNVRNIGGLPAYAAAMTDTFPSGAIGSDLLPTLDGPGRLTRNTTTGIEWQGRLDPDEAFTLTYRLWPSSYCGQVLTNTAIISAPAASDALAFIAPAMDVYQARLYEWDFESDAGGFSANNDWEYGTPVAGPDAAHSGTQLWGTVLAGNYSNSTVSVLSKTLDLSSVESATLVWWQWLSAYGDPDNIFDPFYVEAITQTGSARIIYGSNQNDAERPDLIEKVWQKKSIDLSRYAGETVTLRFILDTSESFNGAGWYIDDVGVYENCDLYVWQGTTSTAWDDADNWDKQGQSDSTFPGADDNVRIPGQGVNRWPTVDDNRTCEDLNIEPGAALTLTTGADLTINGTLRNYGYLIRQQVVDTPGVGVTFAAPNSSGVDETITIITPTTTGLGNVSVGVRAGSACGVEGNLLETVQRCFDLTPDTQSAATIRFYYRSDELGLNLPNTLGIYHWDTATYTWTQVSASNRSLYPVAGWHWIDAQVSDYSPFTLKSGDAPTAVNLAQLSDANQLIQGGMILGLFVCLGGTLYTIRRRKNKPQK